MSNASPQEDAEAPTLGPKLPFAMGRFTLCEEIGAGGMATVYLGKMRLAAGLERLVAIKTIHQHLAKEKTFVDMFLDEAKIASHIGHPNVCSTYDFGNVGGIYYMAMEYLVGEPLFDFVNKVAEDPNDELLKALPFIAARVIADAAEGLHAAHTLRGPDGRSLEVVHRDVSPQNLFVSYEGTTKVVDFGCAKALERVTQTNTGMMKGKVSYAAPEQLNGDGLDARVDVFALGICLWECLTLQQLFRRDNALKTAMAVLEDDIPRADDVAAWVPRGIADVAAKALQRDPDARYQTAREMSKALRGFIVSSGASFEAAEIAEWMRYLFGDRHDQAVRRVAAVEAVDVSKVAPSPLGAVTSEPRGAQAQSSEPQRAESSGHSAAARAALADAPTSLAKNPSQADRPMLRTELGDDEPVVLPTRTGRYAWTLVIVLLLMGGGAFAYFQYKGTIDAALGIGRPVTGPVAGGPVTGGPVTGGTGTGGAGTGALVTGGTGTGGSGTGAEGSAGEGAEGGGAEGGASPDEQSDVVVETTELDPSDPSIAAAREAATAAAGTTPTVTESGGRRGASRRGGEDTQAAAGTPSTTAPSTTARNTTARNTTAPSTTAPSTTAPSTGSEPVRASTTLDFSQGPVMIRTTRGWATVQHNGRDLGRTPLRVQLPVGSQRITLLPNGEGPGRTITVEVEWGSLTQVTVPIADPNPDTTEGWDNPY